MLIARAPVRISLAGGGTDLPAYYEQHGGLVVSTSIDKYFYIFVTLNDTDSVQITSSDYGAYFRQRRGEPIRWDGNLSLPRAFLHEFGIDAGISLFLASEIPPGTGLGSSGAVSVALAKALSTLFRQNMTTEDLAELASYVEMDKLGLPVGQQDQYAAAFGGLNVIRFGRQGVQVEPLGLPRAIIRTLERRLLLFFTGSSRDAASILKHQQESTRQQDTATIEPLHRIKTMAETTIQLLRAGELDRYGALLHESWEMKKRLSRGISNAQIDNWYDVARAHGALGGKLTGAGGGGFLLLYCQEHVQDPVTSVLEQSGLVRMDFRFDDGGAVVLMNSLPHMPLRSRPNIVRAGSTRDA
jgi:D-glycero-alpha-D-manno-heptose-7-phosphate kinase